MMELNRCREAEGRDEEFEGVDMAFGCVAKHQNVLNRILNLGSVSAALEPIEKTYCSMKQSHPIINSVCVLYEKRVSTAGSWAVWSMKPALHVLEPQLVAVNSLACRGLDHIEEKIPALHFPPAELAAGIKKLVSSTLEATKDGIAGPIKHTSNTVMCRVSSGYQKSKITLNDSMQNMINSQAVHQAKLRVDNALTVTENLINYILPASSEETEHDGRVEEQKSDAEACGSKPSLGRLEALAGTIYRRACERTAAQLQHATSQGHRLITHLPGVTSLASFNVDYAERSLKTVGSVLLGLPNSVSAFLKDSQQLSDQREVTDESEKLKSNEVQKLVTGLGQQFQKAYGSVVANVKKVVAKDGIGIIMRSFGTARKKTLHNLLRRQSNLEGGSQSAERDEKDEAEECLDDSLELQSDGADPMHSPPDDSEEQSLRELKEMSEETRLLKNEVMKQIPMQQKVLLEESSKNMLNHSSSREGQTVQDEMPSMAFTAQ